jgi:AraC-like DNA-binding protein
LYIIVSVFVVKTVFDMLYLLDIGRYTGSSVMGCIIAVVIYTIGYMGWRQPEIFAGNAFATAVEKYKSSPLSLSEMQRYKKQLTDIMEKDKPFLNSLLTLKELAGSMGIQSYRLSQVINQQFNQNFFDFVNYYRIKEAKAKLSDPKNAHFSILAIAYDAGFNSKSVFNTAFKKHTGMTPSRFREKSA